MLGILVTVLGRLCMVNLRSKINEYLVCELRILWCTCVTDAGTVRTVRTTHDIDQTVLGHSDTHL